MPASPTPPISIHSSSAPTLAHQFLDQLTPSLRASIMTNPAIRFAGGVSRKDANALDSDMRTTADFLMGMRKRSDVTEFACYEVPLLTFDLELCPD